MGSLLKRAFAHKNIVQPELIGNRFLGGLRCRFPDIGEDLHIKIGRSIGNAVICGRQGLGCHYSIHIGVHILIAEVHEIHIAYLGHPDHECALIDTQICPVAHISKALGIGGNAFQVQVHIQIVFAVVIAYIVGLGGIGQLVLGAPSLMIALFKVRGHDAVVAFQFLG